MSAAKATEAMLKSKAAATITKSDFLDINAPPLRLLLILA
jgi:hypothetical protein